MFDRSYLPAARLEFVVMTDTHYMRIPRAEAVEFENRRAQTARAGVAFAQVAALNTPFVVHLGDLVQTFPGRPDFSQAVDEAQAQMAEHGVELRLAPGNHDVGDKPDPTMPTEWATAASLAEHHRRFGRSWFSWDWEDLHFVVLNSQILNTDLPEAVEQARWAETDLTANVGKRQFLFLHMPPYLFDRWEPALGHYDNLARPGRDWLLDLARQTQVELMCAAHVHFAFFDTIAHGDRASTPPGTLGKEIRYFVTPSPAFTRPGFSELFSGSPPDQQGRNDTPKLGYYLARVQAEGTRLHFMRTGGATELPQLWGETLLTRHPLDLPTSPLGVYLRHPLAKLGDVPVAWPSVIRQRVRNDYPLLLAQEMGVRHMRFPLEELNDPLQRERLALARAEGIELTGTIIWPPDPALADAAYFAPQGLAQALDGVEIQLPEQLVPGDDCREWARQLTIQSALNVTFAPLQPHYTVAGKQHSRTQLGYTPDELIRIWSDLQTDDSARVRALCVVRSAAEMWQMVNRVNAMRRAGSAVQVPAFDWLVALGDYREDVADGFALNPTGWAAQALFIAGGLPGGRIFFDPWQDLDRTMDVAHGFIDRSCNPRPVFHALKTLNTLLFADPNPLELVDRSVSAEGGILHATRRLEDGELESLWLILPAANDMDWELDCAALTGNAPGLRCYDLDGGSGTQLKQTTYGAGGPTLLIGRAQAAPED